MRPVVFVLIFTLSNVAHSHQMDRRAFCALPIVAATPDIPKLPNWEIARVQCSDPKRKRHGLMDIAAALDPILNTHADSDQIRWKLFRAIQSVLPTGKSKSVTQYFDVEVDLSDGRRLRLRPLLRVSSLAQIIYRDGKAEAWVNQIEVVNNVVQYAF